jgi:nucleotide-binding universal stress UspA family protein
MQKFIGRLNYSGNKIVIECVCHQGNLLQIINDLSAQMTNSFIVMGTTGATGLKFSLIGSNTLYVAKNTPLPLIAVPNELEEYTISKIALFTDYNQKDKNTLAGLVSIFGKTDVTYSLIHIHEAKVPASQEDLEKLKDWAAELQGSCEIGDFSFELAEGREVLKVVNEIAERNDINLLALTMADQNFWDRLFEKSFAKAIILQSKSPVFIQH